MSSSPYCVCPSNSQSQADDYWKKLSKLQLFGELPPRVHQSTIHSGVHFTVPLGHSVKPATPIKNTSNHIGPNWKILTVICTMYFASSENNGETHIVKRHTLVQVNSNDLNMANFQQFHGGKMHPNWLLAIIQVPRSSWMLAGMHKGQLSQCKK